MAIVSPDDGATADGHEGYMNFQFYSNELSEIEP